MRLGGITLFFLSATYRYNVPSRPLHALTFSSHISYAYGMGGLEKVAYDSKEKILYGVSEQGFVSSRCMCASRNTLILI